MSLLTILNRVCDDVGLNRSVAPITLQTDRQSLQLIAVLNASGKQLVRDWEWQSLITAATITTVSGTEGYALPTDYGRAIDETQWFTTSKVPLIGPLNQQDWARNKYGLINVGPYYRFQLRGGQVCLQPTPTTSAQTINYYYVSKNWVQLTASTTSLSDKVANDTDTFLLDEDLLFLNTRWRWLRAKRLAYDEEKNEFDQFYQQSKADDRGSRTLSLDPHQEVQGLQTGFIVPITGFGS